MYFYANRPSVYNGTSKSAYRNRVILKPLSRVSFHHKNPNPNPARSNRTKVFASTRIHRSFPVRIHAPYEYASSNSYKILGNAGHAQIEPEI